MRWTEMYVAGTGVALPPQVLVADAIAAGRYDPRAAEASQQISLTVASSHDSTPDFALRAASIALARSDHSQNDVVALLHAVVYTSGLEVWNSGCYIQRRLGITGAALATELRSTCAGAVVGLDLACRYLAADPDATAVLITAADCWRDPQFDRWKAGGPVPYGDGGSAMLVSRKAGFARIIATGTATDPALEGAHRGSNPVGVAPSSDSPSIDLHQRTRAFLANEMSIDELERRRDAGLVSMVQRVLAETHNTLESIDHAVLGFLGHRQLQREYVRPLGIPLEKTTWEYGRRIGHMGAGDQLAAFNHLVESHALAPGDRTLVIGVGGGYQWGAALIETVRPPLTSSTWAVPIGYSV